MSGAGGGDGAGPGAAVAVIDHPGWAEIALNRPEHRNALTPELLDALVRAAEDADRRRDVHAIMLSARGPDFCAGYDLRGGGGREYRDNSAAANGYDENLRRVQRSSAPIRALLGIHKPIIAKVHGRCLAGGTDLALMCDIVIAASDAVIGFPPTRDLGSPPVPMWLYHVGPQWAKRLLLTGDSISGADAARIGLVLKAVPAEHLDGEVGGLMTRLARIDHELLSTQKRMVDLGLALMGRTTLLDAAPELDVRAHLAPTPLALKAQSPPNVVEVLKDRRDAAFGRGLARVAEPDRYDPDGRLI
jgi:enoyl-CoA hydratase